LSYADRIIALHEGKIVFDGSPADLTPVGLEAIYQTGAPPSPPQPPKSKAFWPALNLAPLED